MYFAKVVICLGLFVGSFSDAAVAQDELVIQTTNVPADGTVWVFTPSDYQESQKYFPTVYLLHGYSGTYRQWSDIANLQLLADRFGFIIITPDGFYDSWYLNSPDVEESQYEDFFFRDFLPYINARYRINEEQIFITGLSMGGHGALYLFSQKPDLFRSAGSMSGVVNLVGAGNKYGLSKHLGNLEADSNTWQKHSVSGNLETIVPADKKILLSCGWDDPFFDMNKKLAQKADSLAIDATFISHPGGHNYEYWNKALPYHLFFFKQQLE